MKKIGFIGATDKTNLIMYIAKILELLGKNVIVVDTTLTQKTKYIVPAINPTKAYITDFENIDFAVGFSSMNDILEYLRTSEENLPYDYMLVDVDSYRAIEEFDLDNAEKNYFVSAFDMYSLRKGVQIIKNIKEPIKLSKILCDYNIRKEDEEYLNYLSLETKVIWHEFSIYIPVTGYDKQAIEENQRVFRIKFKRLTAEYLEGILYIVQDIIKDINISRIKKMIKE